MCCVPVSGVHRPQCSVAQSRASEMCERTSSCQHIVSRVCEPRTRFYHEGKLIRYELTSLTIRAVRPESVARARRLALSSRGPAAQPACSARASSPPSSNAVARGRDSLAPRAEPLGDLSGALARQRVACAVDGAVILLGRERGAVGHAGTPRSLRRRCCGFDRPCRRHRIVLTLLRAC